MSAPDSVSSSFLTGIKREIYLAIATFSGSGDFEPFNSQIQHTLDLVKQHFDSTLESECAVCIKWLHSDGKVVTYVRDSESTKKRSFTDKQLPEFDLGNNSAFRSLVDEDREYFLDNDLTTQSANGVYFNINSDWNRYYNAAVVVPIGERELHGSERQIMGFLCVDSEEGRFTELSAIILREIACNLFLLFQLMQMFSQYGQALFSVPNDVTAQRLLTRFAELLVSVFNVSSEDRKAPLSEPHSIPPKRLLTRFSEQLTSVFNGSSEDCPEMELYFDPGKASAEAIIRVMNALSGLHIAAGGCGLEFHQDGECICVRERINV